MIKYPLNNYGGVPEELRNGDWLPLLNSSDIEQVPANGQPILTATGVAPGTYGDEFNVAQFTVDAKGRIFFAGNVPLAAASGTVSNVSFLDGDGFDGTVTTATTTPVISLKTTLNQDSVVFISATKGIAGSANLTYIDTTNTLYFGSTTGQKIVLFKGAGDDSTNFSINRATTYMEFAVPGDSSFTYRKGNNGFLTLGNSESPTFALVHIMGYSYSNITPLKISLAPAHTADVIRVVNSAANDIFEVKGDGSIVTVGTLTVGTVANDNTKTAIMVWDAVDKIVRWRAASSIITTITADNGLTATSATNIQLGAASAGAASPLLHNTFINTGAFRLEVNTNTVDILAGGLTTVNSGGGTALLVSAYGGATAHANAHAMRIDNLFTSGNTVEPILQILRSTGAGGGASGVGGSIDFRAAFGVTGGNNPSTTTNRLISKWATAGTLSQFIITGVGPGGMADLFTLHGTGATQLNKYGLGNMPGTAAYYMAVDATGKLIEVGLPSGTAPPHTLLGTIHTDTVAGAPVLGALIVGNGTPAWDRLLGHTVAGKRFLTQTGTGVNSAIPAWSSIAAGDIPDLSATYVPVTRTITINGSAQDLSANRIWTITTTGTANRITVTGGAGLTPTIDIAATYVGQSSITTVGTITLGTWNGSTIMPIYGGTGITTYTLGDILYASATDVLSKLLGNITTGKLFLSQTGTGVVSAAPVWSAMAGSDITGAALTKTDDTNVTLTLGGTPATALLRAASITVGWAGTLSVTRGGTGLATVAQGDLLYGSAANTYSLLNKSVAANMFLKNSGTSNNPAWSAIAASDITVGAALTRTNDTNVTITLGGTPSSALLAAVSLTMGWTGTLAVTRGGTGLATVVQGDILYASAADTLARLAKNATPNMFLKNSGTTNNPAWSAITIADMSMNTARILGRLTAGVGAVEELTGTQVTSMLDLFSTTTAVKGVVPGSAGVGSTFFLRADGVWAVPPGSGSGGYTTLSQFVDETAWRMYYSNAAGDITPFALGTANQVLQSTGVSAAPTWVTLGGGTIGGTLAATQVAYGSAANTITGSADFIFVSGKLTLNKATGTNLQLGNFTSAMSADPVRLNLGASYSNAGGTNPKLLVYDDGAGVASGFGISASQFDYIAFGGSIHAFYVGATKTFVIGPTVGSYVDVEITANKKISFISSVGEKINFYQGGGGVNDFAMGIAGGTLYYNVPSGSKHSFQSGGVEAYSVGSIGTTTMTTISGVGNIGHLINMVIGQTADNIEVRYSGYPVFRVDNTGSVIASSAGTSQARLGVDKSSNQYAGLWLGDNAPSATTANFTILRGGDYTTLNATGTTGRIIFARENDTSNMMVFTEERKLGIGYTYNVATATLNRRLNVWDGDGFTTAPFALAKFSRYVYPGAAAAGASGVIEFGLTTQANAANEEIGSHIGTVLADGTAGAEKFDFVISNMTGGAYPTEKFRSMSTGEIKVQSLVQDDTQAKIAVWDSATKLIKWRAASSIITVGAVTSLGPVGVSPNANAATITGSVLNLQPASINYPGVVTELAQQFNGFKYFMGGVSIPNAYGDGSSQRLGAGALPTGSGQFNTAIGANAMNAATTGYYTVAVGYGAFQNATTVGFSVAIGANAGLNSNATASVFIGPSAGQNNIGGGSIAIGYGTMSGAVTGTNNIAMGYNTMLNTTGNVNGNVAIGDNVMGNGQSSNNVCIGVTAGASISTGGGNTYLGASAGYSRNGTGNVIIGMQAGYYATVGDNCVFIGQYSGQSSPGTYNTFLGHSSGGAYQGHHAIGIGFSALSTTGVGVGGNFNIAIGQWAMAYAVGSDQLFSNVAIGAYSMQNVANMVNTAIGDRAGNAYVGTGVEGRNCFLGAASGYSLGTGTSNIFIGDNSGRSMTSASFNVIIGGSAGFYTTGSGNVFLGYNAGFSEAGSNKLYIHNNATTAPLIYGDFATPLARVNGQLEVTSAQTTVGRFTYTGGSNRGGVVIDAGTPSLYYNISNTTMFVAHVGGWLGNFTLGAYAYQLFNPQINQEALSIDGRNNYVSLGGTAGIEGGHVPGRRLNIFELGNDNASYPLIRLTRGSVNATGVGFGTGIETELSLNDYLTRKLVSNIVTIWSDMTVSTETADFIVLLMQGGAAYAEKFRVKGTGEIAVQLLNQDNALDHVVVWDPTSKLFKYRAAATIGGGAGGGYTTLVQFVDETAWQMFYSNASGDVTNLAFGTAGQVLQSNGAAAAPTWVNVSSGTVTITPQQVGYGSATSTLTSSADFTFNAGTLTLSKSTGLNLKLGSTTAVTTATPVSINLGASNSNTVGTNLKILLYDDGTTKSGFGISANGLDYVAYVHSFYSLDAVRRVHIDTTQIGVFGTMQIGWENVYGQRMNFYNYPGGGAGGHNMGVDILGLWWNVPTAAKHIFRVQGTDAFTIGTAGATIATVAQDDAKTAVLVWDATDKLIRWRASPTLALKFGVAGQDNTAAEERAYTMTNNSFEFKLGPGGGAGGLLMGKSSGNNYGEISATIYSTDVSTTAQMAVNRESTTGLMQVNIGILNEVAHTTGMLTFLEGSATLRVASSSVFKLDGIAEAVGTKTLRYDPTTKVVTYHDIPTGGGAGGVSSFAFTNANGFAGVVTTATSTPTLTLSTSLTLGSVPFIGAGGALLQDNALFFWDNTNKRLGIGNNAPAYTLQVTGSLYAVNNFAHTAQGGWGAFFSNTVQIPAGATFNSGYTWAGAASSNTMQFAGSSTIAQGAIVAGHTSSNRIEFTAAGATITMTQAAGIRALAGLQILSQIVGTIAGTVTHGASLMIQGVYPNSTGVVNFNNYYGILINPLDEWGIVTFTNRWGIYQQGVNDPSYFASRIQIGNVTSQGAYMLQVTGGFYVNATSTTMRFVGLTTDNTATQVLAKNTAGDNVWRDISSISTGGGGTIGGSIAPGQVAYGSGTANSITGSADITFALGTLRLTKLTGVDLQLGDLTSTATATPAQINLGGSFSNAAGANPKLVLYDNGAGAQYGMGIAASMMFYAVPAAVAHRFYVGTATAMALGTTGISTFIQAVNATDVTMQLFIDPSNTANAFEIKTGLVIVSSISNSGSLYSRELRGRIVPRISTLATTTSFTFDADQYDMYTITALASAIAMNNPIGTLVDGQKIMIRIKDNVTARAISWPGSQWRAGDIALPLTTIANRSMYLGFIWNAADSKWDFIAYNDNFI